MTTTFSASTVLLSTLSLGFLGIGCDTGEPPTVVMASVVPNAASDDGESADPKPATQRPAVAEQQPPVIHAQPVHIHVMGTKARVAVAAKASAKTRKAPTPTPAPAAPVAAPEARSSANDIDATANDRPVLAAVTSQRDAADYRTRGTAEPERVSRGSVEEDRVDYGERENDRVDRGTNEPSRVDHGEAQPARVDIGERQSERVDYGEADPAGSADPLSARPEDSARVTYLPRSTTRPIQVSFAPGAETLDDTNRNKLRRVPLLLVRHPDARIALTTTSSEKSDLTPVRRAAILQQLESYGVPSSRLDDIADDDEDGPKLQIVVATR